MAKKINIAMDEKTKTLAIAVAIAVCGLVISYSMIHKNFTKKIENTRSKIIKEYQRLALSKDIGKIGALSQEYQQYLHKSATADTLTRTLAEVARNAGADIVSIRPQKSEKIGNNYTKIPFSITLGCSYHELGKFIEGIEQLSTVTTVRSLEITGYRDVEDYSVIKDIIPEEDVRTNVHLVIEAYCAQP